MLFKIRSAQCIRHDWWLIDIEGSSSPRFEADACMHFIFGFESDIAS